MDGKGVNPSEAKERNHRLLGIFYNIMYYSIADMMQYVVYKYMIFNIALLSHNS